MLLEKQINTQNRPLCYIVYELKPDNVRAIRQGWRQLTRYRNALEEKFGGIWISILDTYK